MKKFIAFTGICLAIAAGAFFALREGRRPCASFVPQKGDFTETVSMAGVMEAMYYVGIRSPSSPYEKQLTYLPAEGTFVKKGDIIARFDVSPVLDAIELKEENMYSSQFNLENLETEWDMAEYEMSVDIAAARSELGLYYSDTQSLKFYESMRSQMADLQYSSARSQYNASRVKRDGSKRMNEDRIKRHKGILRHHEYRIFRDETYLEDYVLRAPYDSMVVLPYKLIDNRWRQSEVGDFLARGMEFMRLPDFSTMGLTLKIEQALIKNIGMGEEVSFRILSYPSYLFKGKIESISQLASEDKFQEHKKVFEVRVKLDAATPDAQRKILLPGMVATARVPVSKSGGLWRIPKDFIYEKNGESFVLARQKDSKILECSAKISAEGVDWFYLDSKENPWIENAVEIIAK